MKAVTTRGNSLKRNILFINNKGLTAKGYDSSRGFVVLQGSQARILTVRSIPIWVVTLRQALLNIGILKKANRYLVFTQDHSFDTPSAAAGVVMGRSANGRTEWKDKTGRTLKEIQAASVKG